MRKKKIKEFFKPTKWKIILTTLLILLYGYWVYASKPICPLLTQVCQSEGTRLYKPFFPGACSQCMGSNEIVLGTIIVISGLLIFSYLSSCLIIFIINKIKKKIKRI